MKLHVLVFLESVNYFGSKKPLGDKKYAFEFSE
jgi:hypothetical protein